jgi:hypothetical protein
MRLQAIVVAALLLLPGGARADDRGEPPPPACAPESADQLRTWREWFGLVPPYRADGELEQEARRIGADVRVLRNADRLYLALEDGKLAVLHDCPLGDGSYRYVYEKHDELGDFYVVRKNDYEDRYYTLVSSKTGRTFKAYSVPDWSFDSRRFVHGRCSAMNGPDTLYIMRRLPEGLLRLEASFPMPCNRPNGVCEFQWETDTAILVSCTGEQPPRVTDVFRLVLQGETWTQVPK